MKIVKQLKESAQDFEFYPTTSAMARVIFNHIKDSDSVLDIGCGNGNIFNKFQSFYQKDQSGRFIKKIGRKYGIEKSTILINECPKDVIILGTNFNQSTLIDKRVDVVFCNPPYSEYEEWATKIITESFCKAIFLIVPQRWSNSSKIKEALDSRELEATVIHSGDFLDAERAARANIDIIKIDCRKKGSYSNESKDPFETWFKNTFKIKAGEVSKDWDKETRKKKEIKNELVEGNDLVQTLCSLYRVELSKLYKNYQSLGELDQEIFNELDISIDNLIEACKLKISGLKRFYWGELFDKLDKINSRLIAKYRNELLSTLNSQTSVDFDESNIYAVLIWVIKNINNYTDKQIVHVFKSFASPENIINYKSNLKTWEQNGWRYCEEDHSKYTLELRVIKEITHIEYDWSSPKFSHTTQGTIAGYLNDIFVVARSLGFDVANYSINTTGKYEYYARYDGEEIKFLDLKLFKNGNGHFKFNQIFMKKFNVEASRILGWIRSPQEASQEFTGTSKVNEQEAAKFYSNTIKIESKPEQLLLN